MKVTINCPKCNSTKVRIISDEENPVPLYECNKCRYRHSLFPQFENKEKSEDTGIEGEESEEAGDAEED